MLDAPPSLRAQYELTGTRPNPQCEQAWYETGPLQAQLPYSVLQKVRQLVPRKSTVLYDFNSTLLLPMMEDYYIIHSGFHLSIDLLSFVDAAKEVRGEAPLGTRTFEDFSRRRDYSTECLRDFPPVISPSCTDEQDLRFMKLTGVTHLVFDGTKHSHLVDLARRHPQSLHVLAEETVQGHAWYVVAFTAP